MSHLINEHIRQSYFLLGLESKYKNQKYFRVSDEKKCAFKSILGT